MRQKLQLGGRNHCGWPALEWLEPRVLMALVLDVTNQNSTGPGCFADVVASAPEGATVDVGTVPGGTAKFSGTVVVPYNVTLTDLETNTPVVLDWTGPGPSIPPDEGSQLALEPQAGATISNLTITSTWAPWWSPSQSGFGIIPAPFSVGVTVSDVTFEGLYQGFDLEGGVATCNGNTYVNNTYGVVVGGGSLTESDAVFNDNVSAGLLVGLYGTVTEQTGNFTHTTGYDVALQKSSVTLVNCRVSNNGEGDFYNEGGSLTVTPPPPTTPPTSTAVADTSTNGTAVAAPTTTTSTTVVDTSTIGTVVAAPTTATSTTVTDTSTNDTVVAAPTTATSTAVADTSTNGTAVAAPTPATSTTVADTSTNGTMVAAPTTATSTTVTDTSSDDTVVAAPTTATSTTVADTSSNSTVVATPTTPTSTTVTDTSTNGTVANGTTVANSAKRTGGERKHIHQVRHGKSHPHGHLTHSTTLRRSRSAR